MFPLALAAMFFAWTYLASCMVPDSFYNGYVNRLRSALFPPVTALQRAVPRLSERGAAALAFAVALVVAAALARLVSPVASPVPAGAAFGGGRFALPLRQGPDAALALAAGRFAVLLGQISVANTILEWRLGGGSGVSEALGTATWPLSAPRETHSRFAAAFCALFAGAALCVFSSDTRAVADVFGVLRVAALAAADSMLLLGNFLFVGCILSWVPAAPSAGIRRPWWREALDLACSFSAEALSDVTRAIVGPSPFAVGFLSFAPLVACFVLRFLHGALVSLLLS